MKLRKTIVSVSGLWRLFIIAASLSIMAGTATSEETTFEVQEVSAEIMAAGENIYSQHCAYCHQPNGEGDGGAAPPLAANARLADNEMVIRQVLQGSQYMPSFSFLLSDAEIVAVVSYIRNSWGNKLGSTTESQVSEIR